MVVENVLHGIMCKFLRNPQLLFCEIKSLNMDLIETDANFTNDSLLAGFVLFFFRLFVFLMLFLPFLTEMVMKSSNAFVE